MEKLKVVRRTRAFTSTETPSYTYEALSYAAHHHPIRLLKILPGIPSSQISCEITPTHLPTSSDPSERHGSEGRIDASEVPANPTYTALSYVWGDQADAVPIIVDGKELHVTRNLFAFLTRHRDCFLTNGSTSALFWIDAICIDQSNVDERSKQVEFMAEIYKKARNVLIWLGEETENTSTALDIAQKLTARPSEKDSKILSTVFKGGWWDRLW
jgi:Heterokaryon incompatibility protein (HET)